MWELHFISDRDIMSIYENNRTVLSITKCCIGLWCNEVLCLGSWRMRWGHCVSHEFIKMRCISWLRRNNKGGKLPPAGQDPGVTCYCVSFWGLEILTDVWRIEYTWLSSFQTQRHPDRVLPEQKPVTFVLWRKVNSCPDWRRMLGDDGHSVSILDSHGKRLEWNGEDYVEQGSTSKSG